MESGDTESAKELKRLQREYYAGIFDFILEHESTLRGTLRNCCRKQFHLLDDLWSDVVIECVPRAINTYDPTKGELLWHVCHTVRWYTMKWLNRRLRDGEREVAISLFSPGDTPIWDSLYVLQPVNYDTAALQDKTIAVDSRLDAIGDRELVQTILRELSEYDRTLIHLYYVLGWTYGEIASQLGCVESTIRAQCDIALWSAKKIADRLQRQE